MNGPDATRKLVRALCDPGCYPHPTGRIEVVETHISWVLLTEPFAYKIKKPLRLDFLDFSTLERRRRFCEEELRLNRRLAPELYLDVVPIGGSLESPRVGTTPALEFAVKLRRFPADAVLDRALAAGRVSGPQILDLARSIARFHADQPPAPGSGAQTEALANLEELGRALAEAGRPPPGAGLGAWTERRLAVLAPVFAARARAGAVREGHGDLHLENLVVLGERIVPFDALEFSAELRTTDVVDEAAFLAMDLMAHGRCDLSAEFLNRYLELTGDYPGLQVFRFYAVYRALVRAKVRTLKWLQSGDSGNLDERIAPYLRLAERLIRPRRPLLAITHGFSGSGKTSVTDELIARLPALRVRSDLERKRLSGVAPEAHENLEVGAGRYAADATERTYEALANAAAYALGDGLDVIIDASFLARTRRTAFRALAERRGARFAVVDCAAPEATLRRRVRTRAAAGDDASEATEEVLEAQLRSAEPLDPAEREAQVRVDTERRIDYDAIADALRA